MCNCGCEVGQKSCCCENTRKECDCEVLHSEAVDKAKASMISEELLLDISDFYKALSDSTRLKIINLLEKNELCVCDISAIINMTKSADNAPKNEKVKTNFFTKKPKRDVKSATIKKVVTPEQSQNNKERIILDCVIIILIVIVILLIIFK